MEYEPVIGLEIHAQLKTQSKMFCSCATTFGGEPNSQTDPVCLGMPGTLPVVNEEAITMALMLAVATRSTIQPYSIFARKNYFYPDMPKNYQISQYEEPLCTDGEVDIIENESITTIGLTRIHLEEDTGKSLHPEGAIDQHYTRVDFNRAGTPLMEIVSKPVITSPDQAYLYVTTLRQILLYLDICDGNMEEGSLRCDVNMSLRPVGSTGLGTKTEIKNINSFNGVLKSLEYEIERQRDLLESGEDIIQQTLDYDADTGRTTPIRTKEEAHDYRYFPDPDLVPVYISEEWVADVEARVPELPMARRKRFILDYTLPEYDAEVLTQTKNVADYFESVVQGGIEPKKASNWIMTEVMRVLKDRKIDMDGFSITEEETVDLLTLVDDGIISGSMAKEVFEEMVQSGRQAKAIISERGLEQISDSDALEQTVETVLKNSPAEVQKYLDGKDTLFGYFVGQVMKETRGKANPKIVNQVLREALDKLR